MRIVFFLVVLIGFFLPLPLYAVGSSATGTLLLRQQELEKTQARLQELETKEQKGTLGEGILNNEQRELENLRKRREELQKDIQNLQPNVEKESQQDAARKQVAQQKRKEEQQQRCHRISKVFDCSFPDITENCIPCDVMKRLVVISETLGERVFSSIRASVQSFIGIVLALVMLVNAAKLLFPFGPLDKSSMILNNVVTRVGFSLLVATALLSFQNYWRYIHQPVLLGALNLTQVTMQQVQEGASAQKALNALQGSANLYEGITPNKTVLKARVCAQTHFTVGQVPEAVDCTVRQMQYAIGEGLEAGLTIIMYGIPKNVFTDWMSILILIAASMVLLVVYGIAFFNFPMKIADVVIRWTIISVLSPLMLAALIYPATRHYFVNALRGLIQAAMEMVFIGVVIALAGFAIFALGDWKAEQVGGQQGVAYAGKMVLMNSIIFWQLVLVGITMNLMIGKAKSFATELSGAAFDTNVAGEAMDKVTNLAEELANKAKEPAAAGISRVREALSR
jgi:hypothetical protein